jgi:DNA polymerase III delta prime subunit
MGNPDNFTWATKYRPLTVDSCILPENIKKYFLSLLGTSQLPNLIFSGKSGMGKTTIAKALCEELDCDYLKINSSLDRNIDTLRTKILDFASTNSVYGREKVVIFDEADNMNRSTFQPALRAFIEEYEKSCRFIFTCNFKNKLMIPIQSRLTEVDFEIPKGEKVGIMKQFLKRLCFILDQENVVYDKKALSALIVRFFPDFRKTIHTLEKLSRIGDITEDSVNSLHNFNIEQLVEFMKHQKYDSVMRWCSENYNNDISLIFDELYAGIKPRISPKTIPPLVIIIADYSYKSAFAANQEINLLACLTELMVELEYK